MHPTDAITSPDAPAGHAPRSQAAWDLARRDYLAGDTRTQVCDRYGLNPSTFTDRARREGWRKADQPDPPPVPDDDPEAEEPVDCAALAEDALVRVRRALRLGRAGEAASWMRLHEKLTARLEADREAERRRDRVEDMRGSAGAAEPLERALAPLRDRLAVIAGVTGTHLSLARAWRQGILTKMDFHQLSALNDGAVEALKLAIDAADPHSSHPDFSAAPDP